MSTRVRLSYTVDEEDVLKEAAKILSLAGEDMQQAVSMFTKSQVQLKGDGTDLNPSNPTLALEMFDDLKSALLNVATRVDEVEQIIVGYQEYTISERASVDEEASEAVVYPDMDQGV